MEYKSTFKNSLIYIFRINDTAHKGCVKIGEATAPDGFFAPNSKELNDAAKKRINSYTKTAGIKYELLYTEATAYIKNGHWMSFNDKQVHDLLLRSNIKKECFDTNANEWFHCDLNTAIKAIAAVKNGQSSLTPNQKSEKKSPVDFRPEQNRAIEQTKRVLKNGKKMLWNAKMRMGKTLTSLQVVKEMKFHRTIIVTHRPVVDDGWYNDYNKIFYEDDTQWLYGSKNRGESNFKKLERSGKNFIYFASMQDLRGSKRVGGDFDKNNEIFDTQWDLVIIDEAHEGTQTELGKNVQIQLVKDKTKILNLSGTPFNLLETEEYNEDNTFTWDYVMEQQAKQEWAVQHPGDPNPYEELPKLNILTFNLGKLAAQYQDEDKAFNFTEFFKTDDRGNFVYKADIANFLDIISSNKGETLYPFSSEEYREFFHHTFWIVPGVKEGKALTEMLRVHSVFGSYKIVNVCGKEDEETKGDPLEEVRKSITDHPEDTYTITLSCGKLTTGVTVKEWTAVLYLAGSKNTSPAAYMQTIFRVQSPGRIGGKMKTDCYVFDFAPDRTLKMIAQTAKVSAKAGEADREDRIILGDFLNFCPIISYDGTQMQKYNVDQMMQQLKRVYVDKVVNTGFDDGNLYSRKLYNLSNVELESFANLREIIGQTKANKQTKGIDINNQKFDKEDYDKARQKAQRQGKKLTQKQLEQLAEQQKKRRQRDIAVSILRGISIRMPLLLFGAKLDNEDENISLDRFVTLVDDKSWAEFMPLGVSKDKFAEYKKYYDEDIFSAAGKQIRQLALAADKMPVLQRIQRITQIFESFRNPDKETVLTPWRVVNMHLSDTVGGYCGFSPDFPQHADLTEPRFVDRGLVSQRLFENANVKILEINSKSGLYPLYMAYSVFRHRLRVFHEGRRSLFIKSSIEDEKHVWRSVLAENIFVICKTEMARSITIRTLCGFDKTMKANTYVYNDLLEQITKKQSQFIKTLSSGGIFPQIKNNMKFDAIVGNPPYQQIIGGDGLNKGLAKQLFPYFIRVSVELQSHYISLITPARWFKAEAQDKSFLELRNYLKKHNHISKLFFYPNSNALFSNVAIKGGISYFLYEDKYQGLAQFQKVDNDNTTIQNRPLFEKDLDIVVGDSIEYDIIQKVTKTKFISMTTITKGRNAFGIVGKKEIVESISKEKAFANSIKLRCKDNKIRYTDIKNVTKSIDVFKNYKVFISKSAGDPISDFKIIGTPYFGDKNEVCTDSLIPIGSFRNRDEAIHLQKYLSTKFVRYMISLLKVSQNVYQNVYQFVPLQDFTSHSDIDWSKSVAEIDVQLYKKYQLTNEEITFIESMIKPME